MDRDKSRQDKFEKLVQNFDDNHSLHRAYQNKQIMAPITTFVKISKTKAIALRIFINRKSIIKQSTLFEAAISSANTTNHRALVRLKTTQRLLISNRQIREFIEAIKDELLRILFELSPESLVMMSGTKENLKLLLENEGWSCNVIIGMKYILSLREGNADFNGSALLIRQPKKQSKSQNTSKSPENKEEVPGLLVEEDEDSALLKIPEEGEIVDISNDLPDNDNEPVDDKKQNLKYDYKNCGVLGRGIKIELLRIPRKN